MLFIGSMLGGSMLGGLCYAVTKSVGGQLKPHLHPLYEDLLREKEVERLQAHIDLILDLVELDPTSEQEEEVNSAFGSADLPSFLKIQRAHPGGVAVTPRPRRLFAADEPYWVTPGEEAVLATYRENATMYAQLLRRVVLWNDRRKQLFPAALPPAEEA